MNLRALMKNVFSAGNGVIPNLTRDMKCFFIGSHLFSLSPTLYRRVPRIARPKSVVRGSSFPDIWCSSEVDALQVVGEASVSRRYAGIRWVLTARDLGRAQKKYGRGGGEELPYPPLPLAHFFGDRPNSRAVKIRKLGEYPHSSTRNACFAGYATGRKRHIQT